MWLASPLLGAQVLFELILRRGEKSETAEIRKFAFLVTRRVMRAFSGIFTVLLQDVLVSETLILCPRPCH